MLCIFLQGANENDPPQYRLMKTTRLPPDGTFHDLQVIPRSEVFDVLHDAHVSNNVHRKGRALHQNVMRRICGISKNVCNIFVSTCSLCFSKQRAATTRHVGAVTPIISNGFRDRFQIDLMDFSRDPKVINGVEYKYVLGIKDHFTKFSYFRALRNKEAETVMPEVKHYCALMGKHTINVVYATRCI